ncbi:MULTISPECIES: SRPBCC family protein [unclassified Nocardioides]|uniref:SRPBCC family protein n=1 Tax=unclassified Nocardioides TaxID=2615069 RepID=UPI00115035F6|nr:MULTISPECIES: SRPBCC family protein [unclassified Nocardioides]TQK69130.1 polyketide cyclase/dehydrase/lipid transport protein [Nocardioides sp. SLBN-35]WGY01563.1 SRPBCC family protein [Nocardioides sp. QY071]
MPSVERVIVVPRPLGKVWDYLTDFTTTEEWDPPTVTTVRTSGDGDVGTTYRNVSSFLGHETEVEYRVVACVPHELFELTGTASGVDLRDTIRFAEDAGATTVTYRSQITPRGAGKLAAPLVKGGLELLANQVADKIEERLLLL